MRQLKKIEEPQILIDKKDQWLEAIEKALKENDKEALDKAKNKYKHDDIREKLNEECYEKCAYCESKIKHIAYEHIEHIKPKKHYPKLAVEWLNLTLACPKCNINKGSKDNGILHPYEDDVENKIFFLGFMIRTRNADEQADLTIRELELNRLDLVEKRMEKIESINSLFDRYCSVKNLALKQDLKKQLTEECKINKEYSLMLEIILKAQFQAINEDFEIIEDTEIKW